ncbi:hypothetical protein ASU33_07045 [Solirubrum puertoriconensis]|uniref:Uncharacterized protein n=1 Tax=Solirubrum puertoriconensis TaxID=1751427 RepID=A0A9X0HL71_SOLP1|nr:hypothetical protein ASU33_07045 [Solirubrum puertoriconensis]
MFSYAQAGKSAKAANPATGASADKFERDVAAAVCQDLERENKTRSFNQLSKEEAMTLLQSLMTRHLTSNPKELEKLIKAANNDPSAAQAMGQRVGGRLASECPIALALFARLAGAPAPADASLLTATEAERPLLNKLADELCTEFSAHDSKTPLAKMAKADRTALMQQNMQKVMKAHAKEITDLYGPEIFFEQEKLHAFGMKVGASMTGKCPNIVAEFGRE